MRIIDSYNRFGGSAVDTTKQGTRAAGSPKTESDATKPATTGGGDPVSVSAKAVELSQRAAEAADTARINHLRSAIEGGTFKIDHQAIAKRIVDGG